MSESEFKGIKFTDADVVNLDEYVSSPSYNDRHSVRPFLFHDAGFVLAVVFAESCQEAVDIAVDAEKLDRFKINVEDAKQLIAYMTTDVKEMAAGFDPECPEHTDDHGRKWWWKREPSFLGNACEPYDIESLEVVELPNPAMSFCAIFNAMEKTTK